MTFPMPGTPLDPGTHLALAQKREALPSLAHPRRTMATAGPISGLDPGARP
jgi:hypothetical protein